MIPGKSVYIRLNYGVIFCVLRLFSYFFFPRITLTYHVKGGGQTLFIGNCAICPYLVFGFFGVLAISQVFFFVWFFRITVFCVKSIDEGSILSIFRGIFP